MKICKTCKKVVADFELFSTGECEMCYRAHEDIKPIEEIDHPDFLGTILVLDECPECGSTQVHTHE